MTFQNTNLTRFNKGGKFLLHSVVAGLIIFNFGPINAIAADFAGSLNSVSITDAVGTNLPPVASFTYSQNGDFFTFDASGSYDTDGSITEYLWDFGDGMASATGATATANLAPGEYPVTLTVTDTAGGVSITQTTVIYSIGVEYFINFQPASVIIPTGFLIDSGESFDSTRGYGWTTGSPGGTRDRNNSSSPDQRYDTMIHVSGDSIWEAEVPNGTYNITICNGDPSFPTGNQNVQAEGVVVINNVSLSKAAPWAEGTASVNVTDGKLTVTFTGSTNPARLSWLTIKSI